MARKHGTVARQPEVNVGDRAVFDHQRHNAGRTSSNVVTKNKRTVPATTRRSTAASGSFFKLIADGGAHDSNASRALELGNWAFRFRIHTAPAAPYRARSKDRRQAR